MVKDTNFFILYNRGGNAMSLVEKIIRIIVIIGVAICIIFAVKKSDWQQATFWLLTLITLTWLPGVQVKSKK